MSEFDSEIQQAYWRMQISAHQALQDLPVIPELMQEFKGRHQIISPEEFVEEAIGTAQIITVAGAYFGDEAKGKITHFLSALEQVKAIFRLNSGPNAGHGICSNGYDLTFHLVPSAIMCGKPCYIGPETVGDPVALMLDEIQQLVDHDLDYDHLKIGNMHLITPYHRVMDLLRSKSNTSTGQGISPIFASMAWHSELRLDDLFNSEQELRDQLKLDMKHYQGFMEANNWTDDNAIDRLREIDAKGREKGLKGLPQHIIDFAEADDPIRFLLELYQEHVVENLAFPEQVHVEYEQQKILESGGTVLQEATQGFLLSGRVQQFSNVGTADQTHAAGVRSASKANAEKYGSVTINVNKFPMSSRVGAGDIPASFTSQRRFSDEGIDSLDQLADVCVDFDAIHNLYFKNVGENGILKPVIYHDETGDYMICEAMATSSARKFNEKGETTGKPRIVGLFDCVLGRLVADAQGPYSGVSAMDRGDDCDYVGLTIAHVIYLPENADLKSDEQGPYVQSNGIKYRSRDVIKPGDPVPGNQVLQYCHSITKVMPGWKDTPIAASKGKYNVGDLLPETVSYVLNTIKGHTGFEINFVGNGRESESLLFIKEV